MQFFERLRSYGPKVVALMGEKSLAGRIILYARFLALSRYSKDLGWYMKEPDGSLIARDNFLRSFSANCYIRPENLRIPLEGIGDLDVTVDIYAQKHYQRLESFIRPGSVVWDIGANLGVASLIFAQHDDVVHVYGFEPMPHTFNCAQRTLAANPHLAAKITIENLGIGGSDNDLEVSYTAKAKCVMGLSELPARLIDRYQIKPEDMKLITIHIADADRILRSIRQRHPGAPILLKLAAEGAEYGILDRLTETGGLRDIVAACIEWHDNPGEPHVTSRLETAGFQTAAKVLEPDNSIGIVDAWR